MALFVETVVFLLATAMAVAAGMRIADPFSVSPWLMPLVVGSATAIVTLILLASELRLRIHEKARAVQHDGSASPSIPRIAGWLMLTTAYAVLTPIFGFEWTTVVFLLVALQLFGRASLLTSICTAVVMAGILPVVFRHVFHAIVP